MNKQIKCILSLVIAIVALCTVLVSCGDTVDTTKPDEAPAQTGTPVTVTQEDISAYLQNEGSFQYGMYSFLITDDGHFLVVEYAVLNLQTVSRAERFTVFDAKPSAERFDQIESGMTVFDVSGLVGMPLGEFTFGMTSLDYKSNTGARYRVYWNSDMTVQEVTLVSETDIETTQEESFNFDPSSEAYRQYVVDLDPDRTPLPSFEELQAVTVNMTFSEACALLGKPQRIETDRMGPSPGASLMVKNDRVIYETAEGIAVSIDFWSRNLNGIESEPYISFIVYEYPDGTSDVISGVS